MTCFKCSGPDARLRKRRHSLSPKDEQGRIALCDPCYNPSPRKPGNPAYWAFRALCVNPVGVSS